MKPVSIAGMGIISPLGVGLAATEAALKAGRSGIGNLTLFSLAKADRLPVGEIADHAIGLSGDAGLPRCHRLALAAAAEAMAGCALAPEAVIVGCTTGGILTSEDHLWNDGFFALENNEITEKYKEKYRYHGLTTVAEEIARRTACFGPALTVSTACASGGAAIALALALLRSGRVKTVLAGGVDSLSRLTCFGFHSLQLVDINGCKPLDMHRRGINVGEGAGFLLLTTEKSANIFGVVAGAGLSCDAYHASAPHPDGEGAQAAMTAALADAGIGPRDIDYISLHGTGTPDNDVAEAKAIRAIFATPPPLSSIKGATGHGLAAAGGIGAVVSALAGGKGFIPATTGCREIDRQLGIEPVLSPKLLPKFDKRHRASFGTPFRVLSNSLGFGGNNVALVINQVGDNSADASGRESRQAGGNTPEFAMDGPAMDGLAVHGFSCLTGAGILATIMARLTAGESVSGQLPETALCKKIPPRSARRLGRLAKLALTLAFDAVAGIDPQASSPTGLPTGPPTGPDLPKIDSVFFGSGWGALSETYNFLRGLAESEGQFAGPADFVGSTHNSAAGRIAIDFQAKGKNLVFSGGDYSFEQALLAAQTMLGAENALLVAADEGHARFSPLFDPSIDAGETLADGGGGFWVSRQMAGAKCCMRLDFYGCGGDGMPSELFTALGGEEGKAADYAAVFVGAPRAKRLLADRQLAEFLSEIDTIPVWRHRGACGEFASAQAVAAAVAAACAAAGRIPGALCGGADIALAGGQKILVLGLGEYVTAISLTCPSARPRRTTRQTDQQAVRQAARQTVPGHRDGTI